MSDTSPIHDDHTHEDEAIAGATRDIAEVPAVEVITTTAVHLMSAAAVKVGLADDPEHQTDLDEARKLIDALAGLVTASAAHAGRASGGFERPAIARRAPPGCRPA